MSAPVAQLGFVPSPRQPRAKKEGEMGKETLRKVAIATLGFVKSPKKERARKESPVKSPIKKAKTLRK